MATDIINIFDQFFEDIAQGVHNLDTEVLTIALTADAPEATNSVLADLTEIAYTNLSTRVVPGSITATETSGVLKLVTDTDLVLTATGAVATFRYVILYNDTPTSPAKPLIGWWDFGADITMADTETFLIDFDQSGGIFTITQA